MTFCHSVYQRGLISNEKLIEWHISLNNHFFSNNILFTKLLTFIFFFKCYVLKLKSVISISMPSIFHIKTLRKLKKDRDETRQDTDRHENKFLLSVRHCSIWKLTGEIVTVQTLKKSEFGWSFLITLWPNLLTNIWRLQFWMFCPK